MTLTKDDIDRIKESKQACDEVWTRDGGWYGGLLHQGR